MNEYGSRDAVARQLKDENPRLTYQMTPKSSVSC